MRTAELHDELVGAFLDAGAVEPENLLPPGYVGKRADALFENARVIVEVKSLCDDRLASDECRNCVNSVFSSWAKKDGPIVFGTVWIQDSDLPPAMADELVACFGPRVKTCLKDGNRQMRATGEALGWPSYYGLVALITPAHFRTHPGIIGRAAWELLRRPDQAPVVNGIVTFAVPVEEHAPDPPGDLLVIPHSRAGRALPPGLVEAVADNFARRFAARAGSEKLFRQEMTEDDFMTQFMGPERFD